MLSIDVDSYRMKSNECYHRVYLKHSELLNQQVTTQHSHTMSNQQLLSTLSLLKLTSIGKSIDIHKFSATFFNHFLWNESYVNRQQSLQQNTAHHTDNTPYTITCEFATNTLNPENSAMWFSNTLSTFFSTSSICDNSSMSWECNSENRQQHWPDSGKFYRGVYIVQQYMHQQLWFNRSSDLK